MVKLFFSIIIFLNLFAQIEFTKDVFGTYDDRKFVNKELLISPTALTFPQGHFTATNYLFFFWDLNYSITDRTHISIFTYLYDAPTVNANFLAFKQNVYKSEDFNLAIWLMIPLNGNNYLSGGTVSYQIDRLLLNVSYGKQFLNEKNINDQDLLMFGTEFKLSNSQSITIEYTKLKNENFDYSNGLILVGYTTYGQLANFTMGIMRPINSKAEIGIPIIKSTHIFDVY